MKEKLFSVLMSVYYNDNPKYLRAAVESVSIKQTLQPKELILVVDGPVPELVKSEIKALCGEIPYIKTLWKPLNEGLGKALRDGVLIATYHIIARMDSDDISSPTRFEQQIKCMEQDDNIDIVGGSISEFIDTPDNIVGYRTVPDSDAEIKDYMKSRCALNHMSVMFKKESVLKVGNYQDWYWNEDYYLWIRMQLNGCKFANITENLVNVRVGKDMYARRGSMKYFKSEKGIQKFMLENKLIGYPRYCFNVLVRFMVQVVMPNCLRGFYFKKFLESNYENNTKKIRNSNALYGA